MIADWMITSSGFYLQESGMIVEVSASDVIRAEYKGILSISGRQVAEPPSKHFPHIKFNRFPARLQLELMMPKALDDYPHIDIVLVLGESRYVIDHLPQRDQLIVKSDWIPLVPEEVQEGYELLAKHNITEECELVKEFIKELPEDAVLEFVESRPFEPVLWVRYTTAYNWGLIYCIAGLYYYLIAWNPNRPRIMKWKTKFMYLD